MNDVTYTIVEFLSRTLEKYTFVSKAFSLKAILLQQKIKNPTLNFTKYWISEV